MNACKLASFNIQIRDNIQQYQHDNPIIFHVNHKMADDSHVIPSLICLLETMTKFGRKTLSNAVSGHALSVKIHSIIEMFFPVAYKIKHQLVSPFKYTIKTKVTMK